MPPQSCGYCGHVAMGDLQVKVDGEWKIACWQCYLGANDLGYPVKPVPVQGSHSAVRFVYTS